MSQWSTKAIVQSWHDARAELRGSILSGAGVAQGYAAAFARSAAVEGALTGVAAGGVTYYVSLNGKDANQGTSPTQPWRSLERVNATQLAAGDTVCLEGGQRFQGTLKLEGNCLGTEERPVRISSYGQGRALIDAGENVGVSIRGASNIQ